MRSASLKSPKGECLLRFYQDHLQASGIYPNLLDHAKQMACIFGSTYVCEQFFSKMNYTKNKNRARLTDGNLNDCLLLASTNIQPNIKKKNQRRNRNRVPIKFE